jgi:hypothetical protein
VRESYATLGPWVPIPSIYSLRPRKPGRPLGWDVCSVGAKVAVMVVDLQKSMVQQRVLVLQVPRSPAGLYFVLVLLLSLRSRRR